MFHFLLECFSFIAFCTILCFSFFWGGCVCVCVWGEGVLSTCATIATATSHRTRNQWWSPNLTFWLCYLSLAVLKALRLFTVISNHFPHCIPWRLEGWPKGGPPDSASIFPFTVHSHQFYWFITTVQISHWITTAKTPKCWNMNYSLSSFVWNSLGLLRMAERIMCSVHFCWGWKRPSYTKKFLFLIF